MTTQAPTIKLSSGHDMPVLGLGTWLSEAGQVEAAVKEAIKLGYKHFDCASLYKNQKEIGDALQEAFKEGLVKREELFITSKLWNTNHRKEHVRNACLHALKELQLEYLDLYLIHWPIAFEFTDYDLNVATPYDENEKLKLDLVPIKETWEAMEALVDEGLVKTIGVSNFSVTGMLDLLSYARIHPAVNQVESHPYLVLTDLLHFMQSKNIVLTAYSPLARGNEPISDETVVALGKKYSKTPAQILIRWAIDRGTTVVPKTVNKDRLFENFNVFDFKLTTEEVDAINKLDKNQRYINPKHRWNGINVFV